MKHTDRHPNTQIDLLPRPRGPKYLGSHAKKERMVQTKSDGNNKTETNHIRSNKTKPLSG